MEISVTPERRGENGWLGIGLADAEKSVSRRAIEAVRLSYQKNVQYAGLIFEPSGD